MGSPRPRPQALCLGDLRLHRGAAGGEALVDHAAHGHVAEHHQHREAEHRPERKGGGAGPSRLPSCSRRRRRVGGLEGHRRGVEAPCDAPCSWTCSWPLFSCVLGPRGGAARARARLAATIERFTSGPPAEHLRRDLKRRARAPPSATSARTAAVRGASAARCFSTAACTSSRTFAPISASRARPRPAARRARRRRRRGRRAARGELRPRAPWPRRSAWRPGRARPGVGFARVDEVEHRLPQHRRRKKKSTAQTPRFTKSVTSMLMSGRSLATRRRAQGHQGAPAKPTGAGGRSGILSRGAARRAGSNARVV